MAQIEDHLTQIKDRMATGERDVPERLLKNLIGQMGRLELSDWQVDIKYIADQFQKKRRKNILTRILHEGGVLGRLDVMGHFAAHIRDRDWPEMAWEGASERWRRSRESVFEPRRCPRA